MKSYLYMLLMLCTVGLISSCEDEIDVSTVTSFASFGFDGLPTQVELDEVEQTMQFDFTFSEDQIFDVSVVIDAGGEGSTATEGEDFTLSTHGIDVPTLSRAGSFSLNILGDYLTEGDEKIFITLSAGTDHLLPESHTIEVTIKDIIKNDLVLTFDWEGEFLFYGNSYPICPYVDLDVYVLDADGNDLGIYQAATGACPEQIIIDGWDDGTYYMASNLWDHSVITAYSIVAEYPITVTAFKQNTFEDTYVPTDFWTHMDDDQANGGNASFKEVCIVEVSGDTYEVRQPDGTVIAAGFRSPVKIPNQ